MRTYPRRRRRATALAVLGGAALALGQALPGAALAESSGHHQGPLPPAVKRHCVKYKPVKRHHKFVPHCVKYKTS